MRLSGDFSVIFESEFASGTVKVDMPGGSLETTGWSVGEMVRV